MIVIGKPKFGRLSDDKKEERVNTAPSPQNNDISALGNKPDPIALGLAANSGYTEAKKRAAQTANRQAASDLLQRGQEGLRNTFGGYKDDVETQRERTLLSKMGLGENWNAPKTAVGNAIESAAANTTASLLNAAGTLLVDDRRHGLAVDSGDIEATETDTLHNRWGKYLQGEADKVQQISDEAYARGSENLNAAEQVLFDLGIAGAQMLGDAAAGAAAPYLLAARGFGSGAMQARQAGGGIGQQIAYGGLSAGVELLTEKMFDGVAKVYGKGAADDVIQKVAEKLAKTPQGQSVIRAIVNAGGEGLEEMISAIVDPALQTIYNDKTINGRQHGEKGAYDDVKIADILYEGLIGTLLGGIGGGVDIYQTAKQNPVKQMAEVLKQAGASNEDAEKLAPAMTALLNGEEISGNQAAAIATNEAAIKELQAQTGETINTDAPLGEVKKSVRELASRQSAQASESVTEDTPKAETAQAASESETGNIITRMGKMMGKAGETVMNGMYAEGQDATQYAESMVRAYNAGLNGRDISEAKILRDENGAAVGVTDMQINEAFKAGQTDAQTALAKEKAAANYAKIAGTDSGLVYDDYVSERLGKTTAERVNSVAKALGVRVRFVDSVAGGEANAQYSGNEILIEKDNPNPTLFLLGHEWTHRMQDLAPEAYRDFRNALASDARFEAAVEDRIRLYEEHGRSISYDAAADEVAADHAGALLQDGKMLDEFIAKHKENRTVLEKMLDAIRDLIRKLTGAEKRMAQTAEGKLMAALNEAAEQAVKIEKNVKTAEVNAKMLEDVDVGFDAETESVHPDYSLKTWEESEYVEKRNEAAKDLAAALGISERKAKAYIDSVNSVAKMIADEQSRLDYEDSPGRSSFVSNVEYGGSFDFSTLCKKRRLLTGTFTAIQKALPNTALTADEILEIRNMMADKGLEVSCGLCYVEGSRANMGGFTKEFINLYKKYNPGKWAPNMAEMNTPDGIEWVRINHPEVYEQYEYFWNHYGTLKDGDPKLFASQQKPKLYQLHTAYKGEVLKLFNREDADAVNAKNKNGGIRFQSFSDFEIVHLIDTMQVIMDMSRVGLAGQAYTKVPDFAWALGDTGMKINLSLIAKDVDENGNLIFDNREGMNIDDAMALRDNYSENVGTILVAFTDEQIKAAMADDRIDFIIPFHRSQWKKRQYGAMGLPANTKDYTYQQNEKLIKKTYHEYRGRMVADKATNYMPNEYWDFTISGKENAERYLEMCAANNKRPKFYKFLVNNGDGSYSLQPDGSTDGYWKMLIDFKMYDNEGNGVPQRPVRPDYNMEEVNRMLNEYQGGHAQFPVAHGVVDEFVGKYKEEHKGKQFSLKGTTALIEEYGAIEPGENPVRDVQVPRKTEKNKNVSKTVRTIMEAEATPEEMLPNIEEMVENGDFSYETYGDKEAISNAESKIKHTGWASALTEWTKSVESGEVSKDNTAMGWALYNNAANSGDTATALTILDNMVRHQRSAAQALQATRILKKLSPETQLYQVVQSVNRLQEDLNKKNRNQKSAEQEIQTINIAREQSAAKVGQAFSEANVKKFGSRYAVEIEGNQAGEPFVFEYAQKVGESLAKSLSVKKEVKEKTFLQEITSHLKRFAQEKVDKSGANKKPLTATELLREYIQNQDFFNEAWEAAQMELRRNGEDDPALREFINSGIGVDSTINPRNAIFMKALVKSAAESKENKTMLAKQSALGFTGMAKTIADKLIEDTGASGEIANTIRDAATSYVSDIIRNSDADQTKLVESAIKSAMHDIGTTLQKAAKEGPAAKETIKEAIIKKLIVKYGFGEAQASHVADVVGQSFEKMTKESAAKQLEVKFKNRPRSRKEIDQILEEYAKLGAFDSDSIYNEAAAKKIFKRDTVLRIDEELAKRFLNARSQEERDSILREIYRDIGRQMPSTFVDKWNAWRYLAMLGNARTHVRNIVGNAGFAPIVATKNLTATTIESVVHRLSGGKLERSKSILTAKDKDLLKAAWNDYAKVSESSMDGKYNDMANANKYIEEGKQVFKFKPLEAARRGNTKALAAEDTWFAQPYYAEAMASYCKAHGITAEQIAKGAKIVDVARNYAIKEARKATYQDINAFSQMVSSWGRGHNANKTNVQKAFGLVMEGILPFRKTPANILVRGIEYSPIGLMNGIKQAVVDVKNGTKTGAEAIDTISAGLTGTGLLALGAYLAAEGLIRGHGDDEEEKNKFMEMMGHQAYSMELPDGTSVTLDWLAPECLPFFVGVNLWEQTGKQNEDVTLSSILNSVSTVTEPLLEMSCLQSLNDVFDSVGYAASEGLEGLPAALASAATSYLTSALPTLLGQAERSGEDVRMTTYTEKNAFLTNDMQYTLGKASARIPGWDYQQIPYIDAWGRKESSGAVGERSFNNFLNPAYTSDINESAMEKELLRLYETTGETKVFPDRAAKYFNVDKVRIDLTAEQYVKYATAKGQTAQKLMTDLTKSSAYKVMSNADKVDAVSKVYEYANAVAKTKVSGYELDGWAKKAYDVNKKAGVKIDQYIALYLAEGDIGSLKDKSGNTIDNSHSLLVMEEIYKVKGLTDEQRQALFEAFGVGKKVRHYNKALVAEKLEQMRNQ